MRGGRMLLGFIIGFFAGATIGLLVAVFLFAAREERQELPASQLPYDDDFETGTVDPYVFEITGQDARFVKRDE